MKIAKPNRLQRAYIKAVGCRPVVLLIEPDGQRISTARDFWNYEYMSSCAYWFADGATARDVSRGTNDLLANEEASTAADLLKFPQAIEEYCSRHAIHLIPHQNLMSMADETIEIIEKEYRERKDRGEFRSFFKAQKNARKMAKLLGQTAQSAAQDEFDIKIFMLRNEFEKPIKDHYI